VENAGLLLKPGMFVNVDLKSSLGRSLVVPASAVLQTGLRQVVFVSKGNGMIVPQDVVLGPQVGGDIVILKGLAPHQPIVTSAAFLLDSESQLQAASGMQPMQASAAWQASAPAMAAHIDFTSNPDPPHMGTNQIHVKLTAENGTAVSGADVTVAFFMPAMPQMGMAAMSANAKLAEKDPGTYEGAAEFAMGGTWQVTITAAQRGHLIATKRFSVNVKGGM
jgi:Cu(I)/Ag(I) efflux system membrane fusion protein/cobalt-zinc-cadmium efflux system membrane fusion protein